MIDMPQRIWAWDQGEQDQRWSDEPVEGTPDEVEYIQGDIVREAVELMESGMEDSAHEKLKEVLGDE